MPSQRGDRFAGKVAAITGAASGIGRALALDLAGRGCDLALSDVNAADLQSVAEAARAHGVTVTHAVVDVADRQAVHAWADATQATFGRVNYIFNNAGVALSASINGGRYEDLDWILGINLWGVIHGTRAFLPHLIASGEGHVVNLSSVFGLVGIPSQSGYNAAKFAVRGFTDCLRIELEIMNCGVSATCVHPGGIKTNIARAARKDPSVGELGMDPTDDGSTFEDSAFTTPEKAARIILRAVEKNKRRVMVGPDAYLFDWTARLFPGHYHRFLASVVNRLANKRPAR